MTTDGDFTLARQLPASGDGAREGVKIAALPVATLDEACRRTDERTAAVLCRQCCSANPCSNLAAVATTCRRIGRIEVMPINN